MINVHFNVHEISNNVQSDVHYFLSILCVIFVAFLLYIFFTPSKLDIFSLIGFTGSFVYNSRGSYRILVAGQNHVKKPSQREGGKTAYSSIGKAES